MFIYPIRKNNPDLKNLADFSVSCSMLVNIKMVFVNKIIIFICINYHFHYV